MHTSTMFQSSASALLAGMKGGQRSQGAFHRDEALLLPDDLDYAAVSSLSTEIKEKLAATRPATLGAASRISGVTPAALVALLKYVRRSALRESA